MTDKITIEISINQDVYTEAKDKLENLDDYIELKLREYLQDAFSDEVKIMKLIQEKYTELTSLETKLCKAREFRLKKISDKSIFDKIMPSIRRIHNHYGYIGKNQIKQFAKRENIPYDSLLKHIEECGLNVVNYT